MKAYSTRVLFTLLLMSLFAHNVSAQCNANGINYVDFSNTLCNLSPTPTNMVFNTYTNAYNETYVSVYDYTLPTALQGTVELMVKGGNGGNSSINCSGMIYGNGGKGLFMRGTITVGTASNMVPPGSTIRYVIGEAGENSNSTSNGDDYVRGGGGGGSTAVLFKAPGDTQWQILMVAAGGGGGTCQCRPGTTTVEGVPVPFLFVDWQHGTSGELPYTIGYRDSVYHGKTVEVSCEKWEGYFTTCPVKSVVPIYNYKGLTGEGGYSAYSNIIGGGGGGVNSAGQQDPAQCNNHCLGGQSGAHWLSDTANHVMYTAYGDDCIGPRATAGGRGFTGGGGGLSRSNVASAGGGGGIKGGNAGGGYGTSLNQSEGGTSAINTNYITLAEAKADETGYVNGYAYFHYLPSQGSLNMQARIDIVPVIPAPFCDSTEVTFVARPVYPDGSPTDGFTKQPNTPVYVWTVNGVNVANKQNYADSTIVLKYVPGDVISCRFEAKDAHACGRTVTSTGTVTLPARPQPEPVSTITITAVPGDTVCQKRVYDQFGGYTLEAWGTYKATSSFLPVPYSAGNGNYMYIDTGLTNQELALRACEAEYGPGNCSLGSTKFYCNDKQETNLIDRLYMGQLWVDNDRMRLKYYGTTQSGIWPRPIVVTSEQCDGFSYYYRTGTSQTNPGHGTHQYVFNAGSGISHVNEDFSNDIISDSGTIAYVTATIGWNLYSYDTVTFNQTDTVKWTNRYGDYVHGKFPFIRTCNNGVWQLNEGNLGTVLYTGEVNKKPTYNWYRNGYLQGYGHGYYDENGVPQLDTIPFTSDTLFVRNITEGETVTCKVMSPHCSTPYSSNTLTMHVGPSSIGGVISGPQHPCKHSEVNYKISGAQNAESYVWIIDGPAYNITGTDTTRNFWVGEDTVRITCMPIGPCGQGDTARYTVIPGKITDGPCTAAPLIVNTNGVRCEGVPKPATISVYGDFECYEWSNGASTPTITVFDDGPYFVYLNGCKSDVVTISSTPPQHPTVSIALDAALPGQEGPWCRNSNHTKTITATAGNYTGTPNVNYQWYRNGIPYSTQINGLYLNLNTLTSYDTIQCKITLDENCAIGVWSNKIVLPEISGNAPINLGVTISAPEGCSGDTITFTANTVNGGENPTYSWRVNSSFASDTDAVFQRVFNTNVEYPVTYTVYATVFGSPLTCRTGGNVKQISFNYTVNPKIFPAVSISAENTSVCPGSSITYKALGVNGGNAPTYQWYKNGLAAGTNDTVYVDNAPATGDTVYCRFSNTDGNACIAPPVLSNYLVEKILTPFAPVPMAYPGSACLNTTVGLNSIINPNVSDFTRKGFAGVYAPGKWTIARNCLGEISTTQAPTLIDISVLHPPYGPSFTTCNNEMSIVMPESGIVSFDWAYRILLSGIAEDVPLVFLDTTEYRFPEIDYSLPQLTGKSGHFSISVQQGQTLTLRQKGVIYETANQSQYKGSATTFSNFKVQGDATVKWYDAPNGGNMLGISIPGNVLNVTPGTAGIKQYYVEANTDAGCSLRVPVSVTVKAPTTGTDIVSACESYTWINGQTYTANNNTATHTLTGSNGCDSVVTLNLTIKTPATGMDVISTCESYTWIDGNTYTTNNSTATHTLTGSNGCDSVVTLNLTIKNPTSGTDVQTACESYTWINGQTYTASNSTATHTLTGSNGCDSVVTLNLTIKTPTTGTDVISACESYKWIDGNTYTASNSIATHTLTGSNGCDSVVTLNLTIKTQATSTDVISTCESYTWIDGNTYTASNSTATHTLTGSNGCDSVVTLNLTIKTPSTGIDVISACESYKWIDGNTYTTNNSTSTHTLTGSNGCDSITTLNLTIWDLPAQPVITQAGNTLVFTPATPKYSWYLNGTALNPLLNTNPLNINQPGFYEVEITDSNGCTNRSDSLYVISMGIKDLGTAYEVKLFPNPSNGIFNLIFSDMVTREVIVHDMSGRLIMDAGKVTGQHIFNMDVATGIYILSINQSGVIKNIRFSILE